MIQKPHDFYSYRPLLEILLYFRGNIIPFQQGTKETEGTEIEPQGLRGQLSQSMPRIHGAKGRRHNKLNVNLMRCQKKRKDWKENIWQHILWVINNV